MISYRGELVSFTFSNSGSFHVSSKKNFSGPYKRE